MISQILFTKIAKTPAKATATLVEVVVREVERGERETFEVPRWNLDLDSVSGVGLPYSEGVYSQGGCT